MPAFFAILLITSEARPMKYQTILPKYLIFLLQRHDFLCYRSTVSCVNITCFRAKAHLVFHLCLYNKKTIQNA